LRQHKINLKIRKTVNKERQHISINQSINQSNKQFLGGLSGTTARSTRDSQLMCSN